MRTKAELLALIFCLAIGVSGCGGEPSREDVVKTPYYQELSEKLQEKQKRIRNLKEKLGEARARNQGNRGAEQFLEKIERGYIIKIQINDQAGRSCFVDYKPMFSYLKEWIARGQWLTRYSREKTLEGLKPTYEYYLYDEDNSTYMMQVYENDYVCFQERPDDVFVIYGANDLGDAFSASGDPEYKDLIRQMEHSYMAVKGDAHYYQSANIKAFAQAFRDTERTKGKPENGDAREEFLFFYHGMVIQVKFYEDTLGIVGEESQSWYRMSREDLQVLRKILKQT